MHRLLKKRNKAVNGIGAVPVSPDSRNGIRDLFPERVFSDLNR